VFLPSEWWRVAAPTVWLPTVSEMGEIDRAAIESGSIPERALIENAGRALAHLVQQRYPSGSVLALAGSGHNGADAFVAGRTLRAWGRDVEFLGCGSRLPRPDVLSGWGVDVLSADHLDRILSRTDHVLDGILGTGLETEPREPQRSVIERVNAARVSVVAVDGPSGIDFSTGNVPGAAIRADLTVTFGWPKLGLLRFPARSRCGDIVCAEIGFPPLASPPAARAITASWVAQILGERAPDGHKGDAGYVTLVGGERGMAGAIVLAAQAALSAGAGVVRIVSAPENREIVQSTVPGAIFVGWDDAPSVREALKRGDAVGVGPGLGSGAARELVAESVATVEATLVLDADGLNALDGDLEKVAASPSSGVLLTPHPGEAARLLNATVEEVTADVLQAARTLSERAQSTVILKGAPTVVANETGAVRVTTLLSPAFATGGMGDVLTGVCAAYAAAGLEAADAATAALGVTGLAVTMDFEQVGTPAAELPAVLPAARTALHETIFGGWPGVVAAFPAAGGAATPQPSRNPPSSASR